MNRHARQKFFTPPSAEWAPSLNLAEQHFSAVAAQIEDRIVHHCDRPEIEVHILRFIAHAVGPSTEGIATEMGISTAAAEVHLRELRRARRIWGQRLGAAGMSWHLASEGKRFLEERTGFEY